MVTWIEGCAVEHGQSSYFSADSPWSLDIASLRRIADIGNVEAQLVLAKRYHRGDGVVQHLGCARDWYKKAADLQCAEATYEYALMYNEGTESYEDAMLLINRAAEQGFVRAQVYLVLIDLFNPVTNCGFSKEQAETAAAKGDPDALLSLAVRYWTGRDVEADIAWGVRLIERAVDRGSARAELFRDFTAYIAGDIACNERGIALLKRAVLLGNDIAALWLARMFALGLGIPVDPVESRKWLRLAAQLGNKQAVFTIALDDYIFTGCEYDPEKEEELAQLAKELEYPPLDFSLFVD
jgi:TPR repeat protein